MQQSARNILGDMVLVLEEFKHRKDLRFPFFCLLFMCFSNDNMNCLEFFMERLFKVSPIHLLANFVEFIKDFL